jgi:hypothetical protein
MAIPKGLSPVEERRCAAEAESVAWALIVILVALTIFGTYLFVVKLAGG